MSLSCEKKFGCCRCVVCLIIKPLLSHTRPYSAANLRNLQSCSSLTAPSGRGNLGKVTSFIFRDRGWKRRRSGCRAAIPLKSLLPQLSRLPPARVARFVNPRPTEDVFFSPLAHFFLISAKQMEPSTSNLQYLSGHQFYTLCANNNFVPTIGWP